MKDLVTETQEIERGIILSDLIDDNEYYDLATGPIDLVHRDLGIGPLWMEDSSGYYTEDELIDLIDKRKSLT